MNYRQMLARLRRERQEIKKANLPKQLKILVHATNAPLEEIHDRLRALNQEKLPRDESPESDQAQLAFQF